MYDDVSVAQPCPNEDVIIDGTIIYDSHLTNTVIAVYISVPLKDIQCINLQKY